MLLSSGLDNNSLLGRGVERDNIERLGRDSNMWPHVVLFFCNQDNFTSMCIFIAILNTYGSIYLGREFCAMDVIFMTNTEYD